MGMTRSACGFKHIAILHKLGFNCPYYAAFTQIRQQYLSKGTFTPKEKPSFLGAPQLNG